MNQIDPAKNNVGFASGLHGWGFTIEHFARMYAAKFKVKEEKMMRRLWGDHFYNPVDRKWSKTKEEGYVRGFNMFVVEPLVKVRTEY